MAHITGHVRIAVPVEQVFDMVADTRNEPSFNPAMARVELLTPLPIGPGNRVPGTHGQGGPGARQEVRTFATTTRPLLPLQDWLVAQGCVRDGGHLHVLEATVLPARRRRRVLGG